jgi:hypothetical protein
MLYVSISAHLILYDLFTITIFTPEYKLKKRNGCLKKIDSNALLTSVLGEFVGGSLLKDGVVHTVCH